MEPKDQVSVSTILGQNTEQSLRNAAFYSLALAVEGLLQRFGSIDTVVVTGGDGELLAQALRAEYRPELVCDGLRILAFGG